MSLIPLTMQEKTSLSKQETLFTFQGYTIGDYYKNFNMDGYKRMILLLSPVYPSVVNISRTLGNWSINGSSTDKDIDASLTTIENVVSNASGGAPYVEISDFGSDVSRQFALKWSQGQGTSQIGTITAYVSEDNITYTQVYTFTWTNQVVPTTTFTDIFRNWRYVKITLQDTSGANRANVDLFEVYDGSLLGGTATIDFDVLDPSSNTWATEIPSSDIGSFTTGAVKIFQLADVITRLTGSNIGYLFPSTDIYFRAHLNVTGGSLALGVSVIKC